jgi:hypothetical protein
MSKLVTWGLIVFVLGYAIFLTNFNVQFSPTGIANRTAVAAAIGVALSQVGAMGWLSTLFRSERWRRRVYCIFVALLSVISFLINNTIALFWSAAYRQDQEILTAIRRNFPKLPTGSVVLLDGTCPYIGPAIVFEASWELRGALQMSYRDQSLRADIVRPDIQVREDGLFTSEYGFEYHYPYDKLFVYHFGQKKAYQLTDVETARHYFKKVRQDYRKNCPENYEGLGVPVF